MLKRHYRYSLVLTWILLIACLHARSYVVFAQQVTTSRTSTGYFYPLGTNVFNTGCPSNGGTWLGRSYPNGCYTSGYYHIGYDMFNSSTAQNSPVFAMATGTVIYVDSGTSWNAPSGPVTTNTAVFVSHSTSSGRPYVAVYGHLLKSSVALKVNDVVNGGTLIGLLGYWSPPHVHIGVWPDRSTRPPAPWGREPNSQWGVGNYTNSTTNPLAWITGSSTQPKCQNGGSVEYRPGGTTPIHPQGTLFVVKDGPQPGTVYVLYQGQARPIASASVLYQLYGVGRGFDFRDVIQISVTEFYRYPVGAVVSSPLPSNGRNQPDGRLIQQWGGTEISIVTDRGYRRPFSASAFLNLGYQFCNVAGVSDYYSYTVGSPITR